MCESYEQEQARHERISEVRSDDRVMEAHLFGKDQAIEKMNQLVEDGVFMCQQSDWFGRNGFVEYSVFVRYDIEDNRQCLIGAGESWKEAIDNLELQLAEEKLPLSPEVNES